MGARPNMLILTTRQFVRAKKTFTWHEGKKAENTKLRTLCGRLFRHPDVPGKEPEYDKRKNSPPRFSKWCIECQQAHNKLRGKV